MLLVLLSFGYSKLVEIRATAAIIRNYKFKNKHSHAYLMCETLVNSQSQVRARPIHFSLFIASTVQHLI